MLRAHHIDVRSQGRIYWAAQRAAGDHAKKSDRSPRLLALGIRLSGRNSRIESLVLLASFVGRKLYGRRRFKGVHMGAHCDSRRTQTSEIAFLLLVSAMSASIAFSEEPDQRKAVPDDVAQAAAMKTVKDLFRQEYTATETDARRALAQRLLKQGQDSKEDATLRYVLVREAIDIAAKAGDANTTLQALSIMGRMYAIDRVTTSLKALTAVSNASTRDIRDTRVVARAFAALAGEAADADNYDAAAKAAVLAISNAQASKDALIALQVKAKADEIRLIAVEYKKAAGAEKILKDNPEDPQANLIVGRFRCLIKGQWSEGLPALARGADERLKTLAAKELSHPAEPNEIVDLADAWLEHAKKDQSVAVWAEARARHWYEVILSGAGGLAKTKIDKRIDEIVATKVRREHLGPIDLTELEPLSSHVGYAKLGINENGGYPKAPSVDGKPVRTYIYACAPSKLTYDVSGQEGRLFTAKGLVNWKGTDGVVFVVSVDGKEVFRSKVVPLDVVTNIEARLPPGAKVLELIIEPNQNQASDHSFWILPRIE